ncbi:hypothetical protein SLEP1_g37374 [Rubroshorea leprosula]|uniref:Uncharacterized protein n=1 Tax=Rubroshorea leprosula TaxID=152421 RepID=A0AAV5KUU3_9ROSI|nr:hypothetical protein SLEP1_g37374 [Rubroshorea leprosula]
MRESTVHIAETALIGSEIYFNDSNVITILEFSLLIQFSDFLTCLQMSFNQSRNIICSPLNVIDPGKLRQSSQLIFLLGDDHLGDRFSHL